jgi:acetyl-CoA carboxylase carboxyl transferase subunit beta
MAWFKKARKPMAAAESKGQPRPEGLWVKCPGCSQIIYNKDLAANLNVCPKCAHHFRMRRTERLSMLFDGDGRNTIAISRHDPLASPIPSRTGRGFDASRAATGLKDAIIVARERSMRCLIVGCNGVPIHRRQHGRGRRREDHARHRTRARRTEAFVMVAPRPGAGCMEGALSLMQMAKICGASRTSTAPDCRTSRS